MSKTSFWGMSNHKYNIIFYFHCECCVKSNSCKLYSSVAEKFDKGKRWRVNGRHRSSCTHRTLTQVYMVTTWKITLILRNEIDVLKIWNTIIDFFNHIVVQKRLVKKNSTTCNPYRFDVSCCLLNIVPSCRSNDDWTFRR